MPDYNSHNINKNLKEKTTTTIFALNPFNVELIYVFVTSGRIELLWTVNVCIVLRIITHKREKKNENWMDCLKTKPQNNTMELKSTYFDLMLRFNSAFCFYVDSNNTIKQAKKCDNVDLAIPVLLSLFCFLPDFLFEILLFLSQLSQSYNIKLEHNKLQSYNIKYSLSMITTVFLGIFFNQFINFPQ